VDNKKASVDNKKASVDNKKASSALYTCCKLAGHEPTHFTKIGDNSMYSLSWFTNRGNIYVDVYNNFIIIGVGAKDIAKISFEGNWKEITVKKVVDLKKEIFSAS
jgi:hypothetical protein